MSIKDTFNQAITSAVFSTRRNGGTRYVYHLHGPFKAMCYVPKNVKSVKALPKGVYVDEAHPQATEAMLFVQANPRAVRRAREHGIHVG